MLKPIRVISDLHLGHPACRIQHVEQLRPLFSGAATVIFNGDTAELRSPKLRPVGQKYLTELREMLLEMGIEGIFLRGNHDPGISDREFIALENEAALVIHGDCLFDNLSPWNPKIWKLESKFREIRETFPESELQNHLATRLDYTQQCRLVSSGDEERPLSPMFKKLRSALRMVYPPRRPVEILRCWLGLGNRIADFEQIYTPGMKWIMIGHTHRPDLYRRNRGRLIGINTGGFLSLGKAWIVEITDESISIRKVKENGSGMSLGKPTPLNHLQNSELAG